jgi:hypothetical protein
MKDKKTIKELIVEFIFEFETGSNLPQSLRGKIPLQHIAWEFIEDCNALILCLITDRLLKEKSIERIIKTFDECVEVVCEYVDKTEQIKLAMYWMSVINYMKVRCLEEEQFEACSNIKKFSDLYFIITPKDIDE